MEFSHFKPTNHFNRRIPVTTPTTAFYTSINHATGTSTLVSPNAALGRNSSTVPDFLNVALRAGNLQRVGSCHRLSPVPPSDPPLVVLNHTISERETLGVLIVLMPRDLFLDEQECASIGFSHSLMKVDINDVAPV
ncbi:hypothetical protein L6452_09408 [Arctium lappa]|uniref:Uncharacterized protein n=1 Tax=Arctium lappa TaxID=4217 RepID=A0ACB9DL49_ARCLA|nr:hypothetical protein L6452_09408 [Arctium lappa]